MDGLDLIWVQRNTQQGNILFGCGYWSQIPSSVFINELEESFSKIADISHKFKSIILTGDFNICDRPNQASFSETFVKLQIFFPFINWLILLLVAHKLLRLEGQLLIMFT